MPEDKLPDDVLWHQSGINEQGEPFVQLIRGDKVIGQMSPDQARDHGHAMIESAEAAEQDAFVYDWVTIKLEGNAKMAAIFLIEFRRYRAERTNKLSGPHRPGDWVMPTK